jgi:hypothetical protein
MGNILDKLCRENQNTHFMFNNVFPKIAVCEITIIILPQKISFIVYFVKTIHEK